MLQFTPWEEESTSGKKSAGKKLKVPLVEKGFKNVLDNPQLVHEHSLSPANRQLRDKLQKCNLYGKKGKLCRRLMEL